MSREILFRGKVTKVPQYMQDKNRMAVGDWVSGHFLEIPDAQIFDGAFYFHVDPATVGQFTGLCDKNGKKIFEGDVLSKEDSWTFYIGYENGSLNAIPFIPKLSSNWARYMDNFLRFGLCDRSDLFEVIGNIHDNFELLKEESE